MTALANMQPPFDAKDLSFIRRAAREQWNVPPAAKEQIASGLFTMANDPLVAEETRQAAIRTAAALRMEGWPIPDGFAPSLSPGSLTFPFARAEMNRVRRAAVKGIDVPGFSRVAIVASLRATIAGDYTRCIKEAARRTLAEIEATGWAS